MAESTLTLDKLRPVGLTPDQDAYFRELERLLKQFDDELEPLRLGDPLTFDTESVTFDTNNVTWDQETL